MDDGMLMFATSPDFEAPADADTDNIYQVTVHGNAGGEMGEVAVTVTVTNVDELGMISVTITANHGPDTATRDVTVTVTGVDEFGVISGNATHSYAENGTGPVATYTATGPDAATWTLLGDDMGG
jgi:hypothetical protein